MKTPQQLSDEVLQKISARKAKEKRIYRNTVRIGAFLLITAAVIPLSLMFGTKFAVKNEVFDGQNNAAMPEIFDSENKPNPPEDAEVGGNGAANDTETENTPSPEASEECNEEITESSEEDSTLDETSAE